MAILIIGDLYNLNVDSDSNSDFGLNAQNRTHHYHTPYANPFLWNYHHLYSCTYYRESDSLINVIGHVPYALICKYIYVNVI